MNDNNQMSIEKNSLNESKTDSSEHIVFDVQTNILESEKINVSYSENDTAILFTGKTEYSNGTSLNPPKQASLPSDTSRAKTNNKK